MMIERHVGISDNSSKNWKEKTEVGMDAFSMGKSFSRITKIGDIYLRYIQFRTLHRRFYMNNILCKFSIKDT